MLNLGDEQTITPPMSDMQAECRRKPESKSFKLIKGRNGPTTFLSLSPKIGGLVNNNEPSIGQYLTREQANFVYKTRDD